jgi:uncharacterized protein (UPF0332 family)
MTPRQFLDVAEELLEGAHEGHWRTSVSRSYYAAFHAARLLFVQCGFVVPRDQKAHKYLMMRLQNSDHPDLVQAGSWLDNLRDARNLADYDFDDPCEHAHAVARFERASDTVGLLEQAAALPAVCERITEAMRKYERDVLGDVSWRAPSAP